MTTQVSFKNLNIHPQSFDLKNSIIAIKDVELNNLNGFLRSGKQQDTTKVVKLTDENAKEVVPTQAMPWKSRIRAHSTSASLAKRGGSALDFAWKSGVF